MTLPEPVRKEVAAMPPVLRALLEAELAAGNRIEEVGHSFPAPPVGAYFKLAKPLLTRARASGDGIDYRPRNCSLYSGEITDAQRFFFLLEPPAPPPPEPNMDEIRALHTPKQEIPAHRPDATGLITRFRKSMVIDYEKGHDGIGYDLALIKSASAEERAAIEQILLARSDQDWRDIEALAALDTPAAQEALKNALRSPKQEIRVAVMSYAPDLLPARSACAPWSPRSARRNFTAASRRRCCRCKAFTRPRSWRSFFAARWSGRVGCRFTSPRCCCSSTAKRPAPSIGVSGRSSCGSTPRSATSASWFSWSCARRSAPRRKRSPGRCGQPGPCAASPGAQ
jgi:hypothetical protein